MKAKDIMETSVITVGPETTIKELADILTENKFSGVPVVEDGKVIGIVTEGDLLHKEVSPKLPNLFPALGGFANIKEFEKYNEDMKKLSAVKASEIMTTKLELVDEDTDVKAIASIMISKNINRVPVVKDGKLVGIVSRADVLKTLS